MSKKNKITLSGNFIYVCILFVSINIINTHGFAQKNELGLFFGTSYYIGDLNPSRQFALPQMAIGAIYRFNVNEHVAFRINGILGSVAGDDARIKYNENRNLSFRSIIMEASLQTEVNFKYFEPGDMGTPSTPYLFVGGGMFRFNPKAQLDGQWYDLRPHGTEGQGTVLYPERKPYSLYSYNVLFGLGYKFNITRDITGAFEWGLRRTGTDYLDDVSSTYPHPNAFENNQIALALYDRSIENRGENTNFQRGNPNTNDWYSFAGIILTYKISNLTRQKCPAYN